MELVKFILWPAALCFAVYGLLFSIALIPSMPIFAGLLAISAVSVFKRL
jgi:hypothetical protein